MTHEVIGIQPSATLEQAIELMLKLHISGLPVIDEGGKLVGILSEGDLLRRWELGTEQHRARWIEFLLGPGQAAEAYVHSHGRKVAEVMTLDVITATEDTCLLEAVELMTKHAIKRLPITMNGVLSGIMTQADLLRALQARLAPVASAADDGQLRAAILDALKAQQWVPAASIRVEVVDGIASLRGSITDECERRAVRVLVENVPGIKEVHDHLVMVYPNSGMFILSAKDDRDARQSGAASPH